MIHRISLFSCDYLKRDELVLSSAIGMMESWVLAYGSERILEWWV